MTMGMTVRGITHAVALHYGVSAADLAKRKTGGHSRDARQRMLVCWLARRHTSYTMPQIGRYFGGRDHKTVAHAIQRIDRLMRTDGDLASAAAQIREALA